MDVCVPFLSLDQVVGDMRTRPWRTAGCDGVWSVRGRSELEEGLGLSADARELL
jgi:hypothetical protein